MAWQVSPRRAPARVAPAYGGRPKAGAPSTSQSTLRSASRTFRGAANAFDLGCLALGGLHGCSPSSARAFLQPILKTPASHFSAPHSSSSLSSSFPFLPYNIPPRRLSRLLPLCASSSGVSDTIEHAVASRASPSQPSSSSSSHSVIAMAPRVIVVGGGRKFALPAHLCLAWARSRERGAPPHPPVCRMPCGGDDVGGEVAGDACGVVARGVPFAGKDHKLI